MADDSTPTSPTTQALLSLVSSSSSLSSSARLYLEQKFSAHGANEQGAVVDGSVEEQQASLGAMGGIGSDEDLTSSSSHSILPRVQISLKGKDVSQLRPRSLPTSPSKCQPRSIEDLRADIMKLKEAGSYGINTKSSSHCLQLVNFQPASRKMVGNGNGSEVVEGSSHTGQSSSHADSLWKMTHATTSALPPQLSNPLYPVNAFASD